MPSGSDYYRALGVSPDADDVVIRAAYKALMLRYHPDTNPAADAVSRATAINEAYSIIGDSNRRNNYDVKRASYEQNTQRPKDRQPPSNSQPNRSRHCRDDTSSSINLAEQTNSRVGIYLILLLLLGSVLAIALPSNQLAGKNSYVPPTSIDETYIQPPATHVAESYRLKRTPERQVGILSKSEPTSLDFRDIEASAKTFDEVLSKSGIVGARLWSKRCHSQLQTNLSWAAADRCVAFDSAANYVDKGMVQVASVRLDSYFAFQVQNATDTYRSFAVNSLEISNRIMQIRAAAEPAVESAIDDGIASRKQGKEAASLPPEGPAQNVVEIVR